MPAEWMPGATRLDVGGHAETDGGPPKAIGHITWDVNATAAKPVDLIPYERLVDWFGWNPAGIPSAPHVLWDPFTGRVTQFLPASSRSKSLADKAGGTRTNRAGSVVIQVEGLFFPYCRVDGKVYARLIDTPCKGWPELLAWIRSWGVPDSWPMGRPTDFTSRRDEEIWRTRGGWYAHAHVPENDHQDPGSWPAFATEEAPDLDATQAKQLAELHKALVPYAGWDYKGKGVKPDAYADLRAASAQSTAAVKAIGAVGSKVDALKTTALTDAQIAAIADKVAASPTLANRIAELVADKLADRLAN
ncbi:hypothetical protein OG259_07515 [Streptomyces sp. NBC_00250]|uniref:hypothetical protein n=1 Tax=Streptomyces sp. NBC_00250 TaxID=2903641 RepID=UPI002E28AFC8|nr:hypothetical protein [Streptomyces sp. NBC_00250]